MREDQSVFFFFPFFSKILWRLKVANGTVSILARTVKNHRTSLGKAWAQADPTLCVSIEGQRKKGHWLKKLFQRQQAACMDWATTLLLPGRWGVHCWSCSWLTAASQVWHAWFHWHAAQRAMKRLAGSGSSRAPQKHASLPRAVSGGVGSFD